MPEAIGETDPPANIVEEAEGDLFGAPENAVLLHACNCLGSWGAGIAKAFKAKYPTAYKIHNGYCKSTPNQALVGTCQLIPPQQQDYEEGGSSTLSLRSERRKVEEPDRGSLGQQVPCRKRHWIACLFTSIGYGKPTKKHPGMDKPDVILENTRNSLIDLKEQILKLENEENEEDGQVSSKGRTSGGEDKPGELWCCKFNSGLFAVEWTDTREVLEEELKSLRKTIRVVSPAKC